METLSEFVPRARDLVNELVTEVNANGVDLRGAESRILTFVYELAHEMLQQVIEGILEPVLENRVVVDGKEARYKDLQTLSFRDRFGGVVRRKRRRYAIAEESKGWYPLDEKIGMDKCAGFSPLMSYLLCFFGSNLPYASGAEKLRQTLGFGVSATAVQRNTERTGERIDHHPLRVIPPRKQSEECRLMIVEVDGTMSPQIHEEEGITGRESLKQPTEYKECNLISIQKLGEQGSELDRWTGAHYGPRSSFERYASQTALKMVQLQAEHVVFLGDGAKHNWEIQQTHFSGSTAVLDYYHALEHVGHFCDLLKASQRGKQLYRKWERMIYQGQILQVIQDMRSERNEHILDRDEAQKHINYFDNNKNRMNYDEYREAGYPIGSGIVEGQCKLVVGKRFKGSGMRWKRADNKAVLDARLASLNGILRNHFASQRRKWKPAS